MQAAGNEMSKGRREAPRFHLLEPALTLGFFALSRTEEEDDEQHTHDNGDERPGRTDGLYVGFYSISTTRLT